MNEGLTITIDGRSCACERGEYLYDVAARNGIFIPTLCRSDDFPEHRACCRVCIVEVETKGRRKVVTSCVYPVEQECAVYTNSERIKRERAVILQLLHQRAPEAAPIAQMGSALGAGELPELPVALDGEKCVMCGLCVQACDTLGASAISTLSKGTDKHVGAPFDVAPKPCIGCLNCAKSCPMDAIPYSEDEYARSIWGRNFTLVYCEGCGKVLGTAAMFAHARHERGKALPRLCEDCQKD